jgi:hypothetical protein
VVSAALDTAGNVVCAFAVVVIHVSLQSHIYAGKYIIPHIYRIIQERAMSLYAIGDLHLSLAADKPMTVFGGRWENYVEKIKDGFSLLNDDDICVICGDITWSMDLEGAREDFAFIEALPGRKIILKGNHDYWWTTASKAYKFFEQNGFTTMDVLNNNFFPIGEDIAVCGTRGWFYEEESGTAHDKKIMQRELGRLETSLKAAGERKKYVFLHYPPKYGSYECTEILDLLEKYEVPVCCAGHIHGPGLKQIFQGEYRGTEHYMVSADNIFFTPKKVINL